LDHRRDPNTHPATYFGEQLYSEKCSCYIPVSGGERTDVEVKVFRVIGISSDYAEGLPGSECCAVAREIDASPSREWLAVSFGEGLPDMDYFVNIKRKRLYEYKDEFVKWGADGERIWIPADWEDASDKVGKFWANV
jgi:hypothetical protein